MTGFKAYLLHMLSSKWTDALHFQQFPDLVKADLGLEVLRVYHGAKIRY